MFAGNPAPGLAPPDTRLMELGCHPPLCVADGGRLIWGFPLLKAALRASLTALWCVRVEGDTAELLKIALLCEGRKNSYTPAEKAKIRDFLGKHGLYDKAPEISPLVQERGDFLLQADQYDSLPLSVKGFVDEGLLDLKNAYTLFSPGRAHRLPPGVLEACAALLRRLSFSRRR
ncbi:MAG: hypothetical protein E4H36_04420 [Spirochaetales bacterium]|nr:MAG: hypothetical protein E4H36_04420 [Spirochaetales bacterium]